MINLNQVTGSTDNAKYFSQGLIAVELIGFIFACCLANNIRNYKLISKTVIMAVNIMYFITISYELLSFSLKNKQKKQ
uniref:Uncharacterized protein n=1 Tax=Glossina morsitans morsitans TaxID=37546 RepID=A0A1B0GCW0_GLOMM